MALVLVGLLCVGLTAFLNKSTSDNAKNPILGDIIIIIAQVPPSLTHIPHHVASQPHLASC